MDHIEADMGTADHIEADMGTAKVHYFLLVHFQRLAVYIWLKSRYTVVNLRNIKVQRGKCVV
jgi:hypothetical protein